MATCLVTYVDMDGLKHTVEVQAGSLYEAAAVSISSFRKHNLYPAGLAELQVEIRSSIVHTVTVRQLEDWLKTSPRTPKEMITKERLRALL
ncbi:MAG: hypothetical protein ABR607_11275 [Pyrinomonadaceae bacterium]